MVTDLFIEHLGPKGDGIHEGSRGRVYVERALPGDRLKALVERDDHGVPRGEIVKILEASPYRTKAPCAHYDRCGNCTLQHVSANYYQDWKNGMVAEAFWGHGLRPRQWLPTISIGGGKRRRATFTAYKDRGQLGMGYYRRRSQQITDIDECLVVDPRLLALREVIKPMLTRLLTEGTSADIFLQLVGDAVDMVVTGPMGRRGEPDEDVRVALTELMAATAIRRVAWTAGDRDDVCTLITQGPLAATFGELTVNLPPAAFLQPTLEGEQALANAVMAALPKQGKFLDLFAGCGTFTGRMLANGPVDAYDLVPSAVSALAKAGRGKPLQSYRRDLYREPLRRSELNRYDAIVFDPPRSGCAEQVMEMASAKSSVLVGVSCNPQTLARDASMLCEGGYWLQSLQVVDQFQWSHHVEVVAVFTKQKRKASR